MERNRQLIRWAILAVFLLWIHCPTAAGTVFYVDANASGANDGSSWADAYNYLQDALLDPNLFGAAEVWVAQGTYKPDQGGGQTPGDREATFQLINDVALYGGFPSGGGNWASRNPNLYQTILSGDLNGDDEPNFVNNGENSYHVVTSGGTDANTILDGFTITAGNANGTSQNMNGGGMHNDNSSLTVSNCTFSGNSASNNGGGMFNYSFSNPTVTNCTFSGNSAKRGGGMNNYYYSNPTVTNCTFSENSASENGGGMFSEDSDPNVANCIFSRNSAVNAGGGMRNAYSNPTVTNCTFSGNSANHGGGMFNYSYCNSTVTNCTFSGNSVTYFGGGMYISSDADIINCILWGNADGGGTDESAQIHKSGGTVAVNYCCVQGWTGGLDGTGNIGDDPLFVDANGHDNIFGTEDDNLRLSSGSPCIDAGDNTAVPGGIVTDLDGNLRFIDDPATSDTGNGTPPIVDMGVYEYHQTLIYVDASATGANNGSSWADAYNYLQDALDPCLAMYGDEIWVAQGTYRPDEYSGSPGGTGSRIATFQLIDGVAIYGGFPSGGGTWNDRAPNIYKTILSGDIGTPFVNTDNSYHVVTGSGTDANAILDGFSITAGNADGVSWPNDSGGGMFGDYANCTVNECTFVGNSSVYGGAMWVGHGDLHISDCIFFRNAAEQYGGGMGFYQSNGPTLTNCIFSENVAINGGGGMFNSSSSSPTLLNCTFISNNGFGPGNNGGGLYNVGSSPEVINCLFINNSAQWGGGVSNINGSSPTITNCTFKGNLVIEVGGSGACGGINDYNDADPIITNCVLWDNTAPQINDYLNCEATVNFSDVQGGWSGLGGNNIDADPLFWDTKGHLLSNSPCRNTGVPHFIPDPNFPFDMDGQPRVMEGRVDMGADELPPAIWNIDTNEVYDTIQEAIDDANDGETIVVQCGTYGTPDYFGIDFLGKAITLRSSDPNDPNVVAATIIDCVGLGRGFHFHSGEDTNSVLDGFTIINGQVEGSGGAIYCDNSSPTISHCIIRNNGNEGSLFGGGIFCYQSSPTIENCTLRNNTAIQGGGIYCVGSNPTIHGGTIRDNSPDGIWLHADSAVLILGTVRVISNNIVGEGSVQIDPDGSLDLDDAHVFCNMSGPGTMEVDLGAEATIDGYAIIDLGDPCDPNAKGTIECEGTLRVKDNAQITNARINITKATFEDKAHISNSEIHVDSKAPYGQVFADPNTSFVDVNIYADGDRYMDLEPNLFDGNFVNVKIFVTITEGVGQPYGGLLECRGDPNFADVNSCDPNNIFFCRANAGTIPDCNIKTWTLERLELIAGAKLNLTNRFPFQPPYDPGDDYDVVYVKELILRQDSVLNTSYNNIYYDSLIKEPNAVIKNEPLLGFSLINIAFDDDVEFITRVTHNNYTDHNDPNYSRTHVERVEGLTPDVNGMMIMRNLEDPDPNSGTHLARAKGLFSKSNEDEIVVMFEYLFGTSDPNVELVVYLSDVPELLDHNDPCRAAHYLEVARLSPPRVGRPGSAGSGRFGVLKEYVSTGELDFVRGTRIELELVGPEGTCVLINNLDPPVICSGICLDLNYSTTADEEDFLIVISECGESAGVSRACLDVLFSTDGRVDSYDVIVWDWVADLWKSQQIQHLCFELALTGGKGAAGAAASDFGGPSGPRPLAAVPDSLDDLLISGKRGPNDASGKLEDRFYIFDNQGQYVDKFTPALDRLNIRLVQDFDGNLYQVNVETGVSRLDTNEVIIAQGELTGITEPRYKGTATVYVGIQGEGDNMFGRPILDVAFDPDFADNNCVYVVPVVVDPNGEEPYLAAAKLELSSPSYSILQLYDDPNTFDPNNDDNPNLSGLREVEVDSAGNLYVVNAHGVDANNQNESDFLWKYDPNGTVKNCLNLLQDSNLPAPIGMHVSKTGNMLYLASGQNPADANSSVIYGFSTADLTLKRTITINGMGHVTSITEDPNTGTLWAVGFSMDDIPDIPNPYGDPPFYDPNLAEVPGDSNNVTAVCLYDSDPNNDLALPLSIVWTGSVGFEEKCGGADLDDSNDVSFTDFAILALQWRQAPSIPSADIAPEHTGDGMVDLLDLAVFAEHWLESGCTGP